jgi:hypothetical protein
MANHKQETALKTCTGNNNSLSLLVSEEGIFFFISANLKKELPMATMFFVQ